MSKKENKYAASGADRAKAEIITQAKDILDRHGKVAAALTEARNRVGALEVEAQRIVGEDRALTALATKLDVDIRKELGLPLQAPSPEAKPEAGTKTEPDKAAAEAGGTPATGANGNVTPIEKGRKQAPAPPVG